MKLLSKCVPLRWELEYLPKATSASGTEIYLAPNFLSSERFRSSLDAVREIAETSYTVGFEINEGIPGSYAELTGMQLLNPISEDSIARKTSQKFLTKVAKAFTETVKDKEHYFQFQAVGDPYDPLNFISRLKKEEMTKELNKFVKKLKEETGTEIMMENQNRICLCATNPGLIYNTKIGTNLDDWDNLDFRMVLDVSHLALDLYTIGEGITNPSGVQTSKGKFLVETTETEEETGRELAKLISDGDKEKIRERITDEVLYQMKNHKGQIGCIHFDNAGFVGVEVERSEGISSFSEGSIDLNRILSQGIAYVKPDYIVPEVDEVDYSKPVNQLAVSEKIRKTLLL
jgi:hypothetical protein